MIRPYLCNTTNDHKALMKLKVNLPDNVIDYETQFGECKIQLTMQINFISSKDSRETGTMSTKSHNLEIMMDSETDDIIKELRESLLQRYQEVLKEKMKGSNFICDHDDLLYYYLHRTNLKRGRSYLYSPKWLKNKKATINSKIDDNNCFQYALTVH